MLGALNNNDKNILFIDLKKLCINKIQTWIVWGNAEKILFLDKHIINGGIMYWRSFQVYSSLSINYCKQGRLHRSKNSIDNSHAIILFQWKATKSKEALLTCKKSLLCCCWHKLHWVEIWWSSVIESLLLTSSSKLILKTDILVIVSSLRDEM